MISVTPRRIVLLSLALVVSPFSVALGAFSDVPASHDNADAIQYVQNQGIVAGYPDGTYRPDAQINRAELVKIIVAYKFSATTISACDVHRYVSFSDTDATAWYAPFLCIARANGIIDGYPDGTFQLSNPVNFVEAAKIISQGDLFDNGVTSSSRSIPVPEPGEPWFGPYVVYLFERSAIPDSIHTNDFEHLLTRGEMASIVHRLALRNADSVPAGNASSRAPSSSIPAATLPDPDKYAWAFRLAEGEDWNDTLEYRDLLADQKYRFQIDEATCQISTARSDGSLLIKDVTCGGLSLTQEASNSFMGTVCTKNMYQTNLFKAAKNGQTVGMFKLDCTPPPNGKVLTHTDNTGLFSMDLPSTWLSHDAEKSYPIERSLENGTYGPDSGYVMSLLSIRGPRPAEGWYGFILKNIINISNYNVSKETMPFTHNNYTRYDLPAKTDAEPWQSYIIIEKEGYIPEGRDGVIILGFKERNAMTESIIDSLKLL